MTLSGFEEEVAQRPPTDSCRGHTSLRSRERGMLRTCCINTARIRGGTRHQASDGLLPGALNFFNDPKGFQ